MCQNCQNCEFISCSSDFISQNFDFVSQLRVYITQFWFYFSELRVYISQLWLFNSQLRVYITQFWEKKSELHVCITQLCEKKSELWDKKSQLPFLIFIQWRKWASIVGCFVTLRFMYFNGVVLWQAQVMQKIRSEYMTNPDFDPTKVAKASSAAEGLCSWITAMEVYDRVAKVDRPSSVSHTSSFNY